MLPNIIICICTYNRILGLKRLIESINKLEYKNFKVCVVNNNSNGDVSSIIEKYNNVTCIFESKIGVSYARNAFLDYCESAKENIDYIAFLDDDETVGADWINAMLKCFNSNNKIGVVCGPYFPVYFEGEAPVWIPNGIHNINEYNLNVNVSYEKFGVVTGNCMCRYDIIKNSGIRFKEGLGRVGNKVLGGEDTEFFDRLISRKYLYGYTYNAPIYHYIENDRLSFEYFMKRFFYQGVSEYFIKGLRVSLISLPKVVGQSVRLVCVLFTFDKKRIVNNFFKLVKTMGVVSGAILAHK